MSLIDEAFNALFFGSGAILGILLLMTLITALILKWKYTVVFAAPLTVLMSIEYLENDLLYHGFIMLAATIFISILAYKQSE